MLRNDLRLRERAQFGPCAEMECLLWKGHARRHAFDCVNVERFQTVCMRGCCLRSAHEGECVEDPVPGSLERPKRPRCACCRGARNVGDPLIVVGMGGARVHECPHCGTAYVQRPT